MTRIALIAILIPTLVYSTEAVSAPIFYRSQSASSNVSPTTNQGRRQGAIAPSNAPQSVTSNSNSTAPRPKEMPTTNELPQSMAVKTRTRGGISTQQKVNALFENPELIPLGYEVFPKETFQEYVGASFSSFNPGSAFKIETAPTPKQMPFKATLVGVNINAWLENPDMHKELIKAAEKFPIPRLLDNLVQNNPELTFNNPQLTERILNTDIYSPYLSNVTSPPKLPPLFTGYRTAVAFTRNYNIYGASAGGLPYFGTPTEGSDRRINLSVNRHQFREYAVRFPDTDIFLVVTINISPNWLEEAWDIRQENRQFADIFIYAFNRKGKLLGGSGISQSFLKGGQFVTLSQRVYSKYWQSAIPRVFYITPSFKIVNTAVPGSERVAPSHELELSKRPYLNSTQRYILTSIENLRDTLQKPDVHLFDKEGNRTYKHVIPPAKENLPKPFLARRRFILNFDDTNFMPVFNYPAKILAELDGSANLPIKLIAVREPKVSTNTNQRRQQKTKNSPKNQTQEVTNAQGKIRRIASPVSNDSSQARQQGTTAPTNTNSQVLAPRTNLPATNQGAPRRAPSTNTNTSISNGGISISVGRRQRAVPGNKPAPVPLQSCIQSSEHLAKADMSLMLDCVFPLTIEEIEFKAQNAGATPTNQTRAQRNASATNSNPQQTTATTNTNQTRQRGASIAALEEKNIPKATKSSRKVKKSAAEQLQETEDKIQVAREKKFTKDQAKLKRAMGIRRYFPSNEADKLKEMIDVVSERLKEAPYFTTNDLQAVTNDIPPFELETDPATYRSERRKYYSIPISVSRFKKEFAKETRALKSARAARLNDELYWADLHRQMLIENNVWTPSLETQHSEFKKQHSIRKKMELNQLVYQRNSLFFEVISNEIQSYLDRSQKYAQQTVKTKKQLVAITKLQKQADTLLEKSTDKYRTTAYAAKVSNFQETYSNTSSNFISVFDAYVAQKPKELAIPLLQTNEESTKEQATENRQKWMGLARINRVPMQLVAFAEISKRNYPTKVYRAKMKNAAQREYKRNMRFIVYQGYIFVLSGKWRVKTSLADRLDML